MNETQLYARILGLRRPWAIRDMRLDKFQGELIIRVVHTGDAKCPTCRTTSGKYDHRVRRWRHLDTCQYKTILEADVPRVNCTKHGIHQIHVPWSDPGSRFTNLFEALVLDWLKEASISSVCRLMNLSWNAVDRIVQQGVRRGLKRRGRSNFQELKLDETSFRRRHDYVTVVSDEQGRVLHVSDDRKEASLEPFFKGLTKSQRQEVKSVSMDMWPAYINATTAWIPDAEDKISFDRFHISQHLNKTVDKVRRQEHRLLSERNIDVLKGSRFNWLHGYRNLDQGKKLDLIGIRSIAVKTARAWAIKEAFSHLWNYQTRTWAQKAWKSLLGWASRSRLAPVVKTARMIRRHLWGILNSIVLKASNGSAESVNSLIQRIKNRARGFRNKERFRNMIYFHLGGLNCYPQGTHSL